MKLVTGSFAALKGLRSRNSQQKNYSTHFAVFGSAAAGKSSYQCIYRKHPRARAYSVGFLYNLSKHLKGCSVPPVRNGFAITKDFVVFLFLDTFRIPSVPPVHNGFGCKDSYF